MCEEKYRMIASLLSLDIELCYRTINSRPDLAVKLIDNLKEKKDNLINDTQCREARFNACNTISNLSDKSRTMNEEEAESVNNLLREKSTKLSSRDIEEM